MNARSFAAATDKTQNQALDVRHYNATKGIPMIKVTRFNNSVLLINAENIQSVEATPDTVITFMNRDRLLVKEPVEEVTHRIVQYRRVLQTPAECADPVFAEAWQPAA
jgi:flagellar protein FlbD